MHVSELHVLGALQTQGPAVTLKTGTNSVSHLLRTVHTQDKMEEKCKKKKNMLVSAQNIKNMVQHVAHRLNEVQNLTGGPVQKCLDIKKNVQN